MFIKGVSLDEFTEAVKLISDYHYEGNVIVHPDAHETSRGLTARLAVAASRGPGARRSASGRHGPWACWHAYRDVLRFLFQCYPDAVVRTAMATYKGLDGFNEAYPATANRNVGSLMEPAYMPELCDCDDITALDDELVITQIQNWRSGPSEQWEIAQYEHAIHAAEVLS
jgi:hypothetical protein